jgi:hypothetical protein
MNAHDRFIQSCVRFDLLWFRGHFCHELSRGLRAQQLLLRKLGSACCCPRFLFPLRTHLTPIKHWQGRVQTCLATFSA